MHINDLKPFSPQQLADAFNQAFADYFIRMHLTEEMVVSKLTAENVRLEHSVGMVHEGKLVAFILAGIDDYSGQTIAYNAGTGVLPEFRRQGLTGIMYRQLLSGLHAEGISRHRLEVMTQNVPAIKAYERVGFRRTRILSVYRGKINSNGSTAAFEIRQTELSSLGDIGHFWNSLPSWQNSLQAIGRTPAEHMILAALSPGGQLAGYIIFNPKAGKIKQLAVGKDFRKKGVGSSLLAAAGRLMQDMEVMITNVDYADRETTAFLERKGFVCILQQYEMELEPASTV